MNSPKIIMASHTENVVKVRKVKSKKEPSEDVDGAWKTIEQKKGKKKKNRPVPLQDFFNSHPDTGSTGSQAVKTELIRTSKLLMKAPEPEEKPVTFTPEEKSIAGCLWMDFATLLRALGPVQVDNAVLQQELSKRSENEQCLIDKFPDFSGFLLQAQDIHLVDSYLCHEKDTAKAQQYVTEMLLSHNYYTSSPVIESPPAKSVNPWLTRSNSLSDRTNSSTTGSTCSSYQPLAPPSSPVSSTLKNDFPELFSQVPGQNPHRQNPPLLESLLT